MEGTNNVRATFGRVFIVLAAMSLGSALWADVIIPTLYNTGVDDSHAVLGDGAIDPHYKVTPPGSNPYAVTTGWPVSPAGPWIGADGLSTWVRPYNSTPPNDPPASGGALEYTYTTSFYLGPATDLSTVNIAGKWSTDNKGVRILINGFDLGIPSGALPPDQGFTAWYDFTIADHFNQDWNTITFVVSNTAQASGNPTGIRVEMNGTANAVPEGSASLTLVLMAGGLFFLASRGRFLLRLG